MKTNWNRFVLMFFLLYLVFGLVFCLRAQEKDDLKIVIDKPEYLKEIFFEDQNRTVLPQDNSIVDYSMNLKYKSSNRQEFYMIEKEGVFYAKATVSSKAVINVLAINGIGPFDIDKIRVASNPDKKTYYVSDILRDVFKEKYSQKMDSAYFLIKFNADSLFKIRFGYTDSLGEAIKNNHFRHVYAVLKTTEDARVKQQIATISLEGLIYEAFLLNENYSFENQELNQLIVYDKNSDTLNNENINDSIVKEQSSKKFVKKIITSIHNHPDNSQESVELVKDLLESGKLFFTSDNLNQNISFDVSNNSFLIPNNYKNLALQSNANHVNSVKYKFEPEGLIITVDFKSELALTGEYDNIGKPNDEPLANEVSLIDKNIEYYSENEQYDYKFRIVFKKNAKDEVVRFFTNYLETPPSTQIGFSWSDADKDFNFRYNPPVVFSRLWEPIKEKDYLLKKKDAGKEHIVLVQRNLEQNELKLVLDGDLKAAAYLKARLYYTNGFDTGFKNYAINFTKKSIWNEGDKSLIHKINYFLPDSLLKREAVKLVVNSPQEFFFEGFTTDEQKFVSKVELDLPASEFRLTLRRIPAFQFVYLDLTGFDDLEAIKKLLIEKIGYAEAEYLLYISNGSNPVVYHTGDNFDEILKRVSHTRPPPPIIGNEVPKVKPYVDQLVNEKKRIDFNIMVNEVFLNHSTVSFIDQIANEKYLSKLETAINIFSTAEVFSPFQHDFQIEKSRSTQDGKYTNYIQVK